jgi:hypothetical protein
MGIDHSPTGAPPSRANRRALQRETRMHWRKTYVDHEFNWDDSATWNDGECQRLLNFPSPGDGAEKLLRAPGPLLPPRDAIRTGH